MYLLIIGAPRSGTTLLASMISAHSHVAMLIEDRSFGIKKLTGKQVLANKLCIPHQLEIKKRSDNISKVMKKFGMMSRHPTSKYNVQDYLKLKDLKILCIVRDGNDVMASIMKRGKKSKDIALYRWSRALEIINELHVTNPDITAIVSYDDLVNEPEKVLKKISSFIDLEFESGMLEGYKYNILYPGEKGIDKTKANKERATSNGANGLIDHKQMELYQKLLQAKISI